MHGERNRTSRPVAQARVHRFLVTVPLWPQTASTDREGSCASRREHRFGVPVALQPVCDVSSQGTVPLTLHREKHKKPRHPPPLVLQEQQLVLLREVPTARSTSGMCSGE